MNKKELNKRYLLYCILRNRGTQSLRGLLGADSQPVFLVSNNGLTAVVSKINRVDTTPRISGILAYKEVIESLHRSPTVRGVIPMRYGCTLDDKTQIYRLLEKNRSHYTALLKELEGCVEMGVLILIADCRLPTDDSKTSIHQLETRNSKLETRNFQFANRQSTIDNPGKAYLAARKAHYLQEEKFSKQMVHVVERYRSLFSGLFVKCKTEVPSIDSFQSAIGSRQVLSMYFLVPRDSLERFREVFRKIDSTETVKLLLSGPWPPYNFVQPENVSVA
jgi:hypothetical protein